MTINRSGSKLAEIVKISTTDAIASTLGRYGLVIVIGWIGALKFADYVAHKIQPLVARRPFMSWLDNIFLVYTFSALLGVLRAHRRGVARDQAAFPEVVYRGQPARQAVHLHRLVPGFSALSMPGQSLLKDIPLLGLSFWTLAESIRAASRTHSESMSAIAHSRGEFSGHVE